MLQATVFVLGDVGQATWRRLDQLIFDVDGGFIKKLLCLSILLPGTEPLLQQIFVKRVAKSSDRSVLLAPLARLRIEVIRVKIFGTLGRYDNISNLLNLLDVLRVSGDLGQVSELHVQSAKLRQDA